MKLQGGLQGSFTKLIERLQLASSAIGCLQLPKDCGVARTNLFYGLCLNIEWIIKSAIYLYRKAESRQRHNMESAVKALVSKRYPVTTLNLTYENGKKQTHFKFKDWQNATVDDCLEHFVDFRHNAVAIITNDVLVIDGDVLKQTEVQEGKIEDGMIFLRALIEEHGLPEKTPTARTPSGGKHVFFDIVKSLEQGLLSAQNRQKITINEEKKQASLDISDISLHETYRTGQSTVHNCSREKPS